MKLQMSILILLFSFFKPSQSQTFKDGDMIFHTSKSSQSQIIQKITGSKFSHCGIIFYKKGVPYVLEAVQPVKMTPLNVWINRGVGGKYVVTRYKKTISKEDRDRMMYYAKRQLGKAYDIKFQWSDSKMYCSELIYKVYVAGGVTLADCKVFSDYDLKNPTVKKLISQRYKEGFSKQEPVISPVDLYESNLVKTVYSNY
jgi:uncharacterized protein YycO